ncbi:MAG: methyltransferase domain-containing protein [Planctomycetota bacterium]|nr:methyltransferase domain-containing protein [Planctomycetota bacterium]
MVESLASLKCVACGCAVEALRDFGVHVLTNNYPIEAGETLREHPLVLGQCSACRCVQLCYPCPPAKLMPPRPIRYDEPEGHLDNLVDELVSLPGISTASRICGLSYKESTTLERLRNRGYGNQVTLSPAEDFKITDACAGLETLQASMTPELAGRLVKQHGMFDLVVVRHMLEHVHDLHHFFVSVRRLLNKDGYVVFEVPDCTTMLAALDYSFLWEEHVSYFTPTTLTSTLLQHRLRPVRVLNYPRSLENSLVTIVQHLTDPLESSPHNADSLPLERQAAARFATSFPDVQARWSCTLERLARNGPVAVLGAGHLAVTFINLLGLESKIDFVCDDDPTKIGRYVPGTSLRISPSSVLRESSVVTCLMAVAPESEPKVLARQQEFLAGGGKFGSIFAASDLAIELDAVT